LIDEPKEGEQFMKGGKGGGGSGLPLKMEKGEGAVGM